MKCEKCGANNSDKNRFCRDCGKPLKLICSQCGKKIEPGIQFCGSCGKKTNGLFKNKKNKINQKEYSRKYNKSNNNTKVIVISIISAIIVSIIILNFNSFISNFSSGNNYSDDNIFNNLNSGAGENIIWSDEVQKIAANFNCPCEKCGIISLDKCTCDIEKGSIEVKSFIKNLLDQGFSEDEVIQKVDEEYGHRI